MIEICDRDGLEDVLAALADQVARGHRTGVPLGLVGVRTRGVPIAERISARLRHTHGIEAPVGAVDITLYRDDLDRADRWPVLRGTDIGFPVDGAEIVLVDDVLFTGRSARAALNTICDLGRPARVRLAVAVDRNGRELPVQADYAGLRLDVDDDEQILVQIGPVDETDGIVRVTRDEDRPSHGVH